MTGAERAQRIVEGYVKGVICSGEALNQFVDHISDREVEIYMGALSPELIRRFKQALEHETDHPLATAEDLKRRRHAEGLMRAWLHGRSPEPAAPPNGDPAARPGDSGVGGGPPSVS